MFYPADKDISITKKSNDCRLLKTHFGFGYNMNTLKDILACHRMIPIDPLEHLYINGNIANEYFSSSETYKLVTFALWAAASGRPIN